MNGLFPCFWYFIDLLCSLRYVSVRLLFAAAEVMKELCLPFPLLQPAPVFPWVFLLFVWFPPLFFFCMLCLNSGTKPKLGLALCFLPFVFVFFPFLCFVRSPAFSCSHPPSFLFSVALPLSVFLLSFSLFPAFFSFLRLLGSALFFPSSPPCDLSFSGFYSQRTMPFLPTIDCRCNGGGGRPLKRMNSASPQTAPFWC